MLDVALILWFLVIGGEMLNGSGPLSKLVSMQREEVTKEGKI